MTKPKREHDVHVITSEYPEGGQPRILVATPDGTPKGKITSIERFDLDPAITDIDRALDVLEISGRWKVVTAPARPRPGYWTVKAVAR